MRIVAWNIRAGGGTRVDAIARQLARWAPDVVALSEFRATPPSARLAALLATSGLDHQRTTATPTTSGLNALLVASRWPLRAVRLRGAPTEPCRWLLARVDAPAPFTLGAIHVPNRVTGRKYPFLDAVLGCVHGWRLGPALLVGDTNSGRRGVDEEVPAFNELEEGWVDALDALGWADVFRVVRGDTRAYTWYSPNGRNGFRIDQAFVNRALIGRVKDVQYAWARARPGERPDAISDHAALLLKVGGPEMAPHTPQRSGAPRVPRGAPRPPAWPGGETSRAPRA